MTGSEDATGEIEEDEMPAKMDSEYYSRSGAASRPGLVLPKFPIGGFKLRSTGTNLFDGSPVVSDDSSPQEIRASFPLSHKEETRNVVVENLLEKQLSKPDIKVSSMPTTALDREEREGRKAVGEEEECLSASTNSLDEIEEATRRVSVRLRRDEIVYSCDSWTIFVGIDIFIVQGSAMFCNFGIGFNGAETNCGIAHILGILLMISYNTDLNNYYNLQSVHFELFSCRNHVMLPGEFSFQC